jgi:hypothetical protein
MDLEGRRGPEPTPRSKTTADAELPTAVPTLLWLVCLAAGLSLDARW